MLAHFRAGGFGLHAEGCPACPGASTRHCTCVLRDSDTDGRCESPATQEDLLCDNCRHGCTAVMEVEATDDKRQVVKRLPQIHIAIRSFNDIKEVLREHDASHER